MVTVVNNPGPGGTNDSGAAGWIIAIVVIAVVVIGAVILIPRLRGAQGGAAPAGANINVQLPTSGDGGGAAGGGATQ